VPASFLNLDHVKKALPLICVLSVMTLPVAAAVVAPVK
jgi:hypothetical protein